LKVVDFTPDFTCGPAQASHCDKIKIATVQEIGRRCPFLQKPLPVVRKIVQSTTKKKQDLDIFKKAATLNNNLWET